MLVSEVFHSIQGEGIDSGLPTTFVRLAGCNMKCRWCDTKYSWSTELSPNVTERLLDEILYHIQQYNCKRVYITGGEPLLQEVGLRSLVQKLHNKDYTVRIATNGTIIPCDLLINLADYDIDIKCPSSGEEGKFQEQWLDYDIRDNQIKFVVQDQEDLDFTKKMLDKYKSSEIGKWVSPVMDGIRLDAVWLQTVAQFCIDNNCRMSLQLHKIIWGNKKGV